VDDGRWECPECATRAYLRACARALNKLESRAREGTRDTRDVRARTRVRRAVFIDNRRNRVPVIESGVSDNKHSAARLLLQLPMQNTRSRMKREMSMAVAATHAGAC